MAFLDKAGLERLWEHIVSLVGTKVEKVEGKGLSTEDFTTEEKIKLADIEEGATRYVHPVSEVEAGAYTKVTVDAQGHVVAGENPDTLEGFGIVDAASLGDLQALGALIGDTSVEEQINAALLNSQADFNVTDETNPAFIKNKPTEEDAVALLMEMNIVQPMADENGVVYVDENNKMYTL